MKQLAYISAAIAIGCAHANNSTNNHPRQHKVEIGETIASIAQKYYGQRASTIGIKKILEANPSVTSLHNGPDNPHTNLLITIPEMDSK